MLLQKHEEYKQAGLPQSLAGAVLLALFGQEGGPPQEGAQRAYLLLYSCQCHQGASPTVRLFCAPLLENVALSAGWSCSAAGHCSLFGLYLSNVSPFQNLVAMAWG